LNKNKFKQILTEARRVGKRVVFCRLIDYQANCQEDRTATDGPEIRKSTLKELCSDLCSDDYEIVEDWENGLLTLIIHSTNRMKSPLSLQDVKVNIGLDRSENNNLVYYLKELTIAMDKLGCNISCQEHWPSVDKSQYMERCTLTPRLEKIIRKLRERNIDYVRDEYFQVPGSMFYPGSKIRIIDYPYNCGFAFQNTESLNQTYDLFWCLSRYSMDNFIRAGGEKEKAFVVPIGVNPDTFNLDISPRTLDTAKKFKFLFMGWPMRIEGLDILIEAFTEEFCIDEDVCLIVKTPPLLPIVHEHPWMDSRTKEKKVKDAFDKYLIMKGSLEEWYSQAKQEKGSNCPEIIFISESESKVEEFAKYYVACDCFVYPARASSFGINVIEAMACGKPVIVTNCGGYLDFCNETNSYLIDCQLTQAIKSQEEKSERLKWAEPDKQHLKQLMRFVYENPEKAKEVGLRAHQDVSKNWTWENAARKAAESILSIKRNGKKAETFDKSRFERIDYPLNVKDFEPKELYEAFRHFVAGN